MSTSTTIDEHTPMIGDARTVRSESSGIRFYEEDEKYSGLKLPCWLSFRKASRLAKISFIVALLGLILFTGTIVYIFFDDEEADECCNFDLPLAYQASLLGIGQRIIIDGKLDDLAWVETASSPLFVDIQGSPPLPLPRYDTWVKMRWDTENLYVGAHMQETQLWANQTERDSVIYLDNDFEMFVDPDGDNHLYKEFEVNAINTVWDLEMNKPYRDGGVNNNSYTIEGLETAVYSDGVANDPSVPVTFWSFEGKFPLSQLAINSNPGNVPPALGSWWRINFSRVQWQVYVEDGKYHKVPGSCASWLCPPDGIPEDNWVWTPQGEVNMHKPEMWGFLLFVRNPGQTFNTKDGTTNEFFVDIAFEWRVRSILMQVYYAEQRFKASSGHYTADIDNLDIPTCALEGACGTRVEIILDAETGFVASVTLDSIVGTIRGDSKLVIEKSL